MMSKFSLIKRKLVATFVICVIIVAASIVYWPKSQVVEAAIIDPHPGLVGWWRFEEGTGTTAEDSSGNGNDGTIYGDATWVDSKYGKALSFDGTDDYVGCGANVIMGTSDLTMMAWVKTSVAASYPDILNTRGGDVGAGYSLNIRAAEGGRFSGYIGNGATYKEIISSTVVNDGNWHLLTVVFDRDGYGQCYLDGVADGSPVDISSVSGTISNTNNLFLGGRGAYYTGIIDELRIYNRPLSATEIGNLFQKGPDFSSNLLAKVPKGTTQFVATLSWQGYGSINVIVESPSETYTEDSVLVYQKTTYDSGSGEMLNIKRLAVSVTDLSSEENWYILLEFDDVEDYRIIVEVQK